MIRDRHTPDLLTSLCWFTKQGTYIIRTKRHTCWFCPISFKILSCILGSIHFGWLAVLCWCIACTRFLSFWFLCSRLVKLLSLCDVIWIKNRRRDLHMIFFVSFSKIVAPTSRFGYFYTAAFLLQYHQQSKRKQKNYYKKLLLPKPSNLITTCKHIHTAELISPDFRVVTV